MRPDKVNPGSGAFPALLAAQRRLWETIRKPARCMQLEHDLTWSELRKRCTGLDIWDGS